MSDRLKKLVRLRKISEQQASGQLADAQQAVDAAMQQEAALQEMAAEYQAQHNQKIRLDPAMLQHFRKFYNNLSQARAAQSYQTQHARAMHRQALSQYQQVYVARRGLESVTAQRELLLNKEQEKKAAKARIPSRTKSLV